jgi:hypothetical protein
MKKVRSALLCAIGCGFLAITACTGDDITLGPDTGPPKADATVDQASGGDGGVDASPGPRILMTNDGVTAGELVAFNTQSAQVDGRFPTPGFAYVQQSGADLFVLETGQDLVYLLDPASPWTATSSWNVALNDAIDGGETYADPIQVVEVAPNKAYVLRYNRNLIAIIDPTQTVDAGVPTNTVDLSSLQQANDPEGFVGVSGAVFDASKNLLYVALANVNLADVAPDGYTQLCGNTVSTLIAINTMTDALVNLSDAGPGGSVVLNGFGPQSGILGGLVLDLVGNRVLVFSAGCNAAETDGGLGPMSGRLIEAVDLTAYTTQTLLDANDQQYPGNFAYIDGAHAIVQFGFAPYATTYTWIPTQPTLGPALAVTPDLFAYDPLGQRILGPQSTFAADGGTGPMNVIADPINSFDGGGVIVYGQNPFLEPGGYLGSVVYVP